MANPVIYGTEVKYIDDGNTRMVCLTTNVSTSSSPLSLEENGIDYAVPAGKVFVPIRIHAENSETSTNSPFEMWFNTTTDNTTGGTIWGKFRNSGNGSPIEFTLGAPAIAATNYVIIRNSTSGNIYITMIGVETNA